MDIDATDKLKAQLKNELHKIKPPWFVFDEYDLQPIVDKGKRKVYDTIDGFFTNYSVNYESCLTEMLVGLIRQIEKAIDAQKGLDDYTKNRLKDISKPEISKPFINEIEGISFKTYLGEFLFFKWINKDRLDNDLIVAFIAKLTDLNEKYKIKYKEAKNKLANNIREQYQERIEDFAGEVIRLKKDCEGVKLELNTLLKILNEVDKRYHLLEDKIYNRELKRDDML